MDERQSKVPSVRIDPDRLKEYRLRKKWTQRDLADVSGFSEDYISQIERASTTRNKGTKLETIIRLAQALEILPEDLLPCDLADLLYSALDRRSVLSSVASLGIFGLIQGRSSVASQNADLQVSSPSQLFKGPPETTMTLDDEFSYLTLRGLWLQAEEKALKVRTKYREGSKEWAQLTLYCARMRQQAGDSMGTKVYIRDVEQHYLKMVEQANPLIKALIHNIRGWLADEQYGDYKQAYQEFMITLREAQKADDPVLEGVARHFRLRILSELAMIEGGAWLEARPTRVLSHQLLQKLHQSLQEDWPVTSRIDPEGASPHDLNRRFIVYALALPQDAQREIPRLIDISKRRNAEHIVALSLARWQLSNQEWDTASSLADEAFQGYCRIAFPQGIALASAVRAEALLQKGLRTKEDCSLCLDLWVLALLLHPYESHPLWKTVRMGLDKTEQYITRLYPSWMQLYYNDLDVRVWKKEGVFQAMKWVCREATIIVPSWYMQHLLRGVHI